MAERRLNFNAPLLSTRRMHKTAAVSVRRNKSNNFTLDPNTNEIGLASSVPFTWEQSPGRLKADDSITPQQVPDSTQEVTTQGKVMDIFNCPEESETEDVFSDARDTLSRISSNQSSITGVSGYGVADTKNRSEDLQSRDFMLNRFLPAAKAMTVEQPHYGSNRKPSTFMPEPTMQIRDLVPEEKRQNPNKYALVPYHNHQQDIDDEESVEDDDGDVSEYASLSRRGCGMLPQFCFKESVAMLNTVPGFKAKQKSPSHDQVKSSKVSQLKSRFQSIKQLALDSVSKHKFGSKVLSPVHPNLTCAASMSSSPYRHTKCKSPFRNSSPFHPTCFPDTRKETENMRANRLKKHTSNISRSQELPNDNGSASSLTEKTVYVDTEDSPKTNVMVSPEEAEKKPETNLELDELGKIKSSPGRSPLAPPSPKKPTESWLLHNLPSLLVTSQTPSRRYTFHPQKQSCSENAGNVTKWETIVKTSYMHRDHIRYSEELVAHTFVQ
ncbi:unnamed protein product [Eruca vesicaria subsp. sativa]|uniref:Uncharacterized protein n=1 Tax=Eruca vesicaria subsp. sativa TaxID=29727 RepID=A0ABC8ITB4_ERUVS|nr:unnamed protein product [Eruca vesicaria subsp. sativa]